MLEALIGLLLLSLAATFILPLLMSVYQDRLALKEEQALLLRLEEKRYAYDVGADDEGWKQSEVAGVVQYCEQSPVDESEHCVYAKAR